MTNAIERLAARHAAATGGKWKVGGVVGEKSETGKLISGRNFNLGVIYDCDGVHHSRDHNAAFIAAIKNATPGLLAVATIAERICQKLESETASVTSIDMWDLRAALSQIEALER